MSHTLSHSEFISSMDARTKWVLLGLLALIIFPWKGLEYGLFESSATEILDAYAWRSINTSLITLGAFLLLLLRPWKSISKAHLIDAIVSISAFILVLLVAAYLKESLGYSAAIQLAFLLLIFSLALARMGFIQGDPFMTAAIVIIMASIAIFVLFPI
jgi:iron(III) transport system permease protein